MNAFCRYQLRTTDHEAARRFYTALFDDGFWSNGVESAQLPAQAAARGAPPHWLGYIAVDDVGRTTDAFVRAGAERLGPPPSANAQSVILRDPFGAIVALTSPASAPPARIVSWHLLSTKDEEQAMALYSGLFEWARAGAHDLGPRQGKHVMFAWDRLATPAGSTSNLANLPHVHPQWLYFFRTGNIDESVQRVGALGGTALPPAAAVNGDLVAACEDPQGAAFGLYQSRE
jgi:predicted enzyme related to lactoylglutathione lyase